MPRLSPHFTRSFCATLKHSRKYFAHRITAFHRVVADHAKPQ